MKIRSIKDGSVVLETGKVEALEGSYIAIIPYGEVIVLVPKDALRLARALVKFATETALGETE